VQCRPEQRQVALLQFGSPGYAAAAHHVGLLDVRYFPIEVPGSRDRERRHGAVLVEQLPKQRDVVERLGGVEANRWRAAKHCLDMVEVVANLVGHGLREVHQADLPVGNAITVGAGALVTWSAQSCNAPARSLRYSALL
jgi:hypothetical protein